jgi:hypothetical protein
VSVAGVLTLLPVHVDPLHLDTPAWVEVPLDDGATEPAEAHLAPEHEDGTVALCDAGILAIEIDPEDADVSV